MDQKRLGLAIAISLAIMLGFQFFVAPHLPKTPPPAQTAGQTGTGAPATMSNGLTPGTTNGAGPQVTPEQEANRVPENVPRVPISAPKLTGSISLLGARLDDIVLTDYRETVDPASPRVRLLEPRSDEHPYYVQYGWTAPPGEAVTLPNDDTVWTATSGPLTTA